MGKTFVLCAKMLAKLTPGVNFINVLRAALAPVDPKSVKRYSYVISIFLRFGDLQA